MRSAEWRGVACEWRVPRAPLARELPVRFTWDGDASPKSKPGDSSVRPPRIRQLRQHRTSRSSGDTNNLILARDRKFLTTEEFERIWTISEQGLGATTDCSNICEATLAIAAAQPSGPSTMKKDHLPGGASRLAALLVVQICPIFSLLAPCHPDAALRFFIVDGPLVDMFLPVPLPAVVVAASRSAA